MRKIYSLVLMATMLLLGTTAGAVTDCSTWTAVKNAAEANPNAEIRLTGPITMPVAGVDFDFNGAVIDCRYETTSVLTGEDSVGYNYLYASKAKTYTLRNVTLKNYQGSYGAIRSNAANAVINLGNTVNIIDSKYSVYASKAATITNDGNIAGVNMKAGGSLTNNGTITGANAAGITAAGTTTIKNQAGAQITGATYGIQITDGEVTNNGTINGASHAVYVKGAMTFVNDGEINASTHTFLAAATAVMNITNNTNMDWSIYPAATNAADHTIVNKAGNFTFHGWRSNTINFTGNITISGEAGATATINQIADLRADVASSLTLNNITVAGGVIRTAVEGSNITVTGGTFVTAPAAGATGTIAGECKFPAGPAIGDFTIASGYRGVADGHIYAVSATPGQVIMLTHNDGTTQTFEYLEEAFNAAQDGEEISLLDDIDQLSTIWIGTETLYGTAKSLTLDLAGHSITADSRIDQNFIISHGSLLVKNSVPGQGGIYHMSSGSIFALYGSYLKNCDPRINTPFTHLTVEEGVDLYAQQTEGSGVVISEIKNDNFPPMVCDYVTYLTNIYGGKYGVANGVRVDMKGNVYADRYGVKVNGNVTYPYNEDAGAMRTVDPLLFPDYQQSVARSDSAYTPYIYIHPSAKLISSANHTYATAIYSSGYGRWLIAGTCTGATGLYAKSGDIELNDAIIESTYSGDATTITGGSSGITSGGNAIVIETNVHYPGLQDIDINGDTKVSTNAEGGAAVIDVVSDASNTSLVEGITINGGSFSGDYAIVISEKTATDPETEITVGGVTLIGETEVGTETGQAAINTIIDPESVHTTTVDNPDGSKTVIISAGAAPATDPSATYTSWDFIAGVATDSLDQQKTAPSLEWTKLEDDTIKTGTIYLKELLINSGTGTAKGERQQLVINDGASLQVERLIMNDYARIIVEAGGKLIVEGEQGINAPNVENITLRTSEDKQALFLFHPNVTSNRHPNATVEFATKSYRKTEGGVTTRVYQRFGIPTYVQISDIESNPSIQTALYAYGWGTTNDWDMIGILNGTPAVDYTRLNEPFESYQMLTNASEAGTVYKMKGEIVGNIDASLNVYANAWQAFSNSYTAEIDVETLVNDGNYKSIYVYRRVGAGYAWDPVGLKDFDGLFVSAGTPKRIAPMQSFYVRSSETPMSMDIDYTGMVWDKRNYVPSAPARMIGQDITLAKLTVSTNEESNLDNLYLMGADRFSEDFEDGYDAEKLMNDGCNLYVMGDTKLCSYATTELQGTYLGFSCVEGGVYTINFSNLNGVQLVLVDLVTGARTIMVDDATYQFTAQDNEANDYRFQIIGRQEMPTDIESVATETIGTEGIYTITGQYVGNMSIWNTLPAGLYIVDGVKKVK